MSGFEGGALRRGPSALAEDAALASSLKAEAPGSASFPLPPVEDLDVFQRNAVDLVKVHSWAPAPSRQRFDAKPYGARYAECCR